MRHTPDTNRSTRSGGRRHRLLAAFEPYLMLSPAAAFILLIMVVPLLLAFAYSVQYYVVVDPFGRRFVGLDNYWRMLQDPVFVVALRNTAVWTLASLLLQFVLGFTLAMLLNAGPFPLKGLYQSIVFLPWAVPAFLIGLVWKWMYNAEFGIITDVLTRLHLLEGPTGLLSRPDTALFAVVAANVWFGIPFFAIMLLAGLQAIPPELYEAAAIDGASGVRQFLSVTVPLLRPTIVVSLLLRTIWIANFPDLIYLMTGGGPANASQTLATYIFTTTYESLNFGYGAALSVALFALLSLYTVFALKVGLLREG